MMACKKSKFDFGLFTDGSFVASKLLLDERGAWECFCYECNHEILKAQENYIITNQFVRWGYGCDDDGENRLCWWIVGEDKNNYCPVWVFEKKEGKI